MADLAPQSRYNIQRKAEDSFAHGNKHAQAEWIPGDSTSPPSGREQFEQVIDLLYRRRWTIFLSFFLVVIGVVAYTFTLEPQYQAHSFIMLDLGKAAPIAGEVAPSESELQSGRGGLRSLSTELFVLETSRTLANRVRERLQEQNEASQADGLPSTLELSEQLPTNPGAFVPRGYVSFAPANRSVGNAIRVTATSPVPREAALLANLYTEEYVRLTQEASRSYLSAHRTFLEEQEEQRREELSRIEERVLNYKTNAGAVGLNEESSSLIGQVALLEAQRDEVRLDLQMRQATLTSIEEELEAISPQLVQRFASGVERQMQGIEEQLTKLEADKATILLSNPNFVDGESVELEPLNRQIQRLQDQLERLAQQNVDEVFAAGGISSGESGLGYVADLKRQAVQERIQINGLQSRLGLLESRLNDQQYALERIPGVSLELAQLERSRLHAEQMYQYVVQRLQAARVSEESEPGYAQVIREAVTPLSPVYPDPQRNLILGIFFGLLLGLGLAVVRDKLDNQLYKPDQLTKRGYKVIGIIPDMHPLIKEDHGGDAYMEHDGRRFATSLVTLHNPMSAIAETYRQVRTNVEFSLPGTDIQTLLVTSPNMEEGKSTTAANLAISMARAGRRTLLLDGDLRRPQQHRILGLNPEKGLMQYLVNDVDIDAVTLKTDIDLLSFLPVGRMPASEGGADSAHAQDWGREGSVVNASELIGSRRMKKVLEKLKDQFDIIVIDMPPILAATDAVLLATQCDATILVARAGQTREGELDVCMKMLREVGATVIGTLFNAFNISNAYGYKYRYRHYTRYGYYSKYGYYGYKNSSKKGWRRRASA